MNITHCHGSFHLFDLNCSKDSTMSTTYGPNITHPGLAGLRDPKGELNRNDRAKVTVLENAFIGNTNPLPTSQLIHWKYQSIAHISTKLLQQDGHSCQPTFLYIFCYILTSNRDIHPAVNLILEHPKSNLSTKMVIHVNQPFFTSFVIF
jgi:hypothetical protein